MDTSGSFSTGGATSEKGDRLTYPLLSAFLVVGGLWLGMLLFLEAGRRIGDRRRAADAGAAGGTGAIEGAVFALFGLLVAFTFSSAASRFDARRELVVREANAIGTAYLRLDLLPAEAQPALRALFRAYLDSRLETYRLLSDIPAAEKELAHSVRLQGEIWARAVAASAQGQLSTPTLVLSALNEMFDIVTTRMMATRFHAPALVFALLFGLGLGCSFLAGYGMAGGRKRNWVHMIGFATITAISIYVILDMEYPRLGLIRVNAADRVLVELRQSMH
jgi:hypothetical protein